MLIFNCSPESWISPNKPRRTVIVTGSSNQRGWGNSFDEEISGLAAQVIALKRQWTVEKIEILKAPRTVLCA